MMKIFHIVLIAIVLLTNFENLSAQSENIRSELISAEHGLSQGSVECIFQDTRGFMWFGTKDGLNRYDGYDIVQFRHSDDDQNSISSNHITCIIEVAEEYLLIGTHGGGLNRYNINTGIFENYQYSIEDSSIISSNFITDLVEGKNKNIWIATDGGGLNLFNYQTQQFSSFRHNPNDETYISSNHITRLINDKNGHLWIGTSDRGLNKLDIDSGTFTRYFLESKYGQYDRNNNISSLIEEKDGDIFIGTQGGGIFRYSPGTDTIKQYSEQDENIFSISHSFINDMVFDEEGYLWCAFSGYGMDRFSISTETFLNFTSIFESHFSGDISSIKMLSIFIDRSGIMWIGMDGYGILKMSPSANNFHHLTHKANNPQSISMKSVRAIFEDTDGNLWLGGYSGFDKYNKDGSVIHYERESYWEEDVFTQKIKNKNVYVIHEDIDDPNLLWIGIDGGGLIKFNKNGNLFYNLPDGYINGNSVFTIQCDNNNIVWIGTDTGLNKLNKITGEHRFYEFDPRNSNSINQGGIKVILKDGESFLWIGSDQGGISRFDKRTETFKKYTYDPQMPYGLSHNTVYSAIKDKKGNLWIGTSGGLNRYDPDFDNFQHFKTSEGLPNNVIYGILEDDFGNLWISTNVGLSRFNSDSLTFTNYDIHDGLQSNEFNGNAYFKNKNGKMYFGGVNGLNAFYPEAIMRNKHVPPVVITKFKILNKPIEVNQKYNNKTILISSITETKEIELSYKDYVFSFEFAAMDYHAPNKNQYAYIMENFEEKWNYVGNIRNATYTNLPAGEYNFRVKASNNNGYWNEEGTSIRLIITPPYWRTWWFKSAAYFILIGSIFGTVYWRINYLKRRNIVLEDNVKVRTKELNKKSHELEVKVNELEGSLQHIKKLEGFLPICSGCKKIRLEEEDAKRQDSWVQIEQYIADRTDADFSHGICPECREDLYGDISGKN